MARKVFFSFHYANDIWRVSQIRKSWTIRPQGDAQPFLDKAEWEKVKKNRGIQSWIDEQLKGCGVTCILFGEETANRPWVKYELEQSHLNKKGLFGISLEGMLDSSNRQARRGKNPFENFTIIESGQRLSEIYPIYRWIADDGRANIPEWVEKAAKAAGR